MGDSRHGALWYTACDGHVRMGPYGSELAAYHALRMAPRKAETRIVMGNSRDRDLGLHLVEELEVPKVMLYSPDASLLLKGPLAALIEECAQTTQRIA